MSLNFSSAQTRQSFGPAGGYFARLAVGVIASLSMLLFSTFATAGNTYGVVEMVAGKVSVIDVAGKPRAIRVNDKILEGETIVAESDGQLHVRTEDYGYAVFRANSKIVVQSYLAEGGKDDNVVISIVYGALRSVSGWIGKHNPEKYSGSVCSWA